MSGSIPQKKSFQWMTLAGVSISDAAWMDAHYGSPELHLQPNSQRVENIFRTALKNMMASPNRLELSKMATLN
jgi:hypothetical protein